MTSSYIAVLSMLMLLYVTSGVTSQDITVGSCPFREMLDDNYELSWNFNTTHIVFEVHVKTNGYVGFGISGTGAMFPSDVIIGWVSGGEVHFADRHATGFRTPEIDDSQDWFLISGREYGDYTTLTMVRELTTCDDQDMDITNGITHIIYSYYPTDPTSETIIPYHGPERRGSKVLHLLNPALSSRPPKPLPNDAMFVDFLNQNYTVPGKDTMYSCTTWKLPDLGGKQHMIRFEPLIQEGHEKLVHHMILYFCALPLADEFVNIQYECYDIEDQVPPIAFKDCQHVFAVWAVGGGPVELPDHVGIPLGTAIDPSYFILETHYDNPSMRNDYVDSSGMRLTLTKQIRQNDAGILELGIKVSEFPIVPPFNDAFLTQGFCQEECLEQGMGDQDEVYMFGNMLHSHLMGRKMRTRMIRNGTELAPVVENNHYDFNYQEYTFFDERPLRKGDSFITECVYDSSDRQMCSWGGLSTRDEMCLSFILYYPRIPLTTCLTKPYYELPPNTTKHEFWGYIHMLDWKDPAIQDGFRTGLQQAPINNICLGRAIAFDFNDEVTLQPDVMEEYVAPDVC